MPSGPGTVEALLKLMASEAQLRALAPGLTLGAAPRAAAVEAATGDGGATRGPIRPWTLPGDGLGAVPGVASADLCRRLVSAIEALHSRGLPAALVYAFDEPWALGERVRERIAALVGRDYVVTEDVWAWRVAPGSAGWPAHRGVSHVVLERDAPELLNVWVALADVTVDRAAMHAVPLGEDQGYPDALSRVDTASGQAMPVGAGDALFWNANVLHWGGACAPSAAGPRYSCSFTLRRADAAARVPDVVTLPPLATLDLPARTDLLARMVLLYGDASRGDVSAIVRDWASITHTLAARFGPRKAP